jgi:hypothetical protein
MAQRLVLSLCLSGALLLLVPAVAGADGLLTLFGGATPFSSNAASSPSHTSLAYGGTLTFKVKGSVGAEVDFGYSNHITGLAGIDTDNARSFVGNMSVDIGPKHGRIQPYVSGGGGLLRLKLASIADVFVASSKYNDPVFDVGGGVLVAASKKIGFRGDLRYFRDLAAIPTSSTSSYHLGFWRITGGITFGF